MGNNTGFLSCFKTLDTIEEEEPKWYVDGLLPEGQIITLASDGGVGKTTLSVNLAACRSAGKACFLDPPSYSCEPQRIAFLSSEDSVRKKLKRKLREAGANMENIVVPDFSEDTSGYLREFKFGLPRMNEFISYFKPALCIFDPLQGFIPPQLNMGSRNAMRDCMAPLVTLGEKYGTTFIVICHTNKRKGASGRDRIADSADLWDISRSVLMLGFTEDQGIRYLSHEKSNYGELMETRLFTISGEGQIVLQGTTWKRDRDFQQETAFDFSAPRRDEVKEWLLNEIDRNGGDILTAELDRRAKDNGYANRTLRRAKEDLKTEGKIEYFQTGAGREKAWHTRRVLYPEEWDK